MRNIYFLFLFVFTGSLFAQDTTAFRLIGVGSGMELDYFYNDSTSMGDVDISPGGSGHAIFINPADSLLYCIIDVNYNGDRNLYKVNPFTGATTLVHDFTTTHINSGDIAANGKVYAVTGNGGGTNGEIFELDLTTMTETSYFNSSVSDSRGLEFNPIDSSIYIYEGFSDMCYKINMATKVETNFTTTGLNDELHGAYFDTASNSFFLSAYYGPMYITDPSWVNGTMYHDMDNGVTGNNVMDMTHFMIIKSEDTIGFCPGDSMMINTFYSGATYQWYMDDVAIPGATGGSFYAKEQGKYKVLAGITMNQGVNYMWSREIFVDVYTRPNVVLSSQDNDTLLCTQTGETILLNGANGGTLQWFLDGVAIPGANANTFSADKVGSYNQSKINMSGCADSSHSELRLYKDTTDNCWVGVNEQASTTTTVYPNPVQNWLTVTAANEITSIAIYNILGNRVYNVVNTGKAKLEIDFSPFTSGIYLVQVESGKEIITRRIIK